eukprot:314627-Amphidinium_carterae.1
MLLFSSCSCQDKTRQDETNPGNGKPPESTTTPKVPQTNRKHGKTKQRKETKNIPGFAFPKECCTTL